MSAHFTGIDGFRTLAAIASVAALCFWTMPAEAGPRGGKDRQRSSQRGGGGHKKQARPSSPRKAHPTPPHRRDARSPDRSRGHRSPDRARRTPPRRPEHAQPRRGHASPERQHPRGRGGTHRPDRDRHDRPHRGRDRHDHPRGGSDRHDRPHHGGNDHRDHRRHRGHDHGRHRGHRHQHGHHRHHTPRLHHRRHHHLGHHGHRHHLRYGNLHFYRPYYRRCDLYPYAANYATVYVDIYSSYNVVNAENGWELLADGYSFEALRWFADEVQRYPNHGALKIGFALALAVTGDLEEGIVAMGRAFEVENDSIAYIVVDERLIDVIDGLIVDYAPHAERADVAFMISALFFLQRDLDQASAAIDYSIDKAERPGSLTLREMIRQELNR